MIDFLEPAVRFAMQPLVPGIGLVVAGAVVAGWWQKRWGWGVLAAGVLVVWLPATNLVAVLLAQPLETAYTPRPPSALPEADAIVVLGGAVGAALPPRVEPDLHGASDRVWFAARLYRAERAPAVVASGGSAEGASEASAMQTMLVRWGVPDSAVVEEGKSLSTYANARYTARIMDERGWEDVLLVTSGLHMPRAAATFRRAGVRVHPAPTDLRVPGRPLSLDPNPDALQLTTSALHEYVATLAYRLAGRL